MGIMEYNGSAIVAMKGKNCIAIATDKRLGVKNLTTVSCNFPKAFELTEKCYVGLSGLATDIQTVSAMLKSRMKLYRLEHGKDMDVDGVMKFISNMMYAKRFGPWMTEPVVVGLDENEQPHLCSYDFIGAQSISKDFTCAGTTSDQLMGICESFYQEDMDEDTLFETISQCLLCAVDRDCLAGWGGVVHLITPKGVHTRTIKGRMD